MLQELLHSELIMMEVAFNEQEAQLAEELGNGCGTALICIGSKKCTETPDE